MFQFRPGTDDASNYNVIVNLNEYRLPEQFSPTAVMVDIGVQCGCFVEAALLRGAGKVIGYEAERVNYEHALVNLRPWILSGKADIRHGAVWRSDGRGPEWLTFCPSENPNCTGGGNVLWGDPDGQRTATVPLDPILEEAAALDDGHVTMLKVDCEGAEWPILFTATRLNRVDAILGEYHEIGGPHMALVRPDQAHKPYIPEMAQVGSYTQYTAAELQRFLESWGFAVEIVPGPAQPWLGWFFARKR